MIKREVKKAETLVISSLFLYIKLLNCCSLKGPGRLSTNKLLVPQRLVDINGFTEPHLQVPLEISYFSNT